MEHAFWHQRWESGQLGFHKDVVHPRLVEHIDALDLAPGSRVFVPLCGKTLDVGWLLGRGLRVSGAELSEIAVRDLFAGLGIEPRTTPAGPLALCSAAGLDIYVGDIFDLSAELLGPVDAVYDRAALVALPAGMRPRYAAHMRDLTARAPQLLITFTYDQGVMDGPPFSVPAQEVIRHYGDSYEITERATAPVPGGLKGITPADETVWLLR